MLSGAKAREVQAVGLKAARLRGKREEIRVATRRNRATKRWVRQSAQSPSGGVAGGTHPDGVLRDAGGAILVGRHFSAGSQ
jgi:hypothetical protein